MDTNDDGLNAGSKRITVGKLLELLRELPEDTPVLTEGCDCTGGASGIDYSSVDKEVVITRLSYLDDD